MIKKEGYVIFLDDVRDPMEEDYVDPIDIQRIKIARNYGEFVDIIHENGLPSRIYFDHDLGEEKTGLDCAKFLTDYHMDNGGRFPDCIVHSANPVGRSNILSYLNAYTFMRAQRRVFDG